MNNKVIVVVKEKLWGKSRLIDQYRLLAEKYDTRY